LRSSRAQELAISLVLSCDHGRVTWTLGTERLKLRPMELGDLDALAPILAEPFAMRFYPKPFDRSMARLWIERTLERYERDGFGLLAVVERATGEMLGDCGPAVQQTGHGTFVELGWHIRLDRQGNGYATEAGRVCRDHAWSVLDVDRLISIIRPENVPSWSVARALGFRPWRGDVRVGMAHILWLLKRSERPA
jgi:RimJ/RimL family protein N-acetyltransferase